MARRGHPQSAATRAKISASLKRHHRHSYKVTPQQGFKSSKRRRSVSNQAEHNRGMSIGEHQSRSRHHSAKAVQSGVVGLSRISDKNSALSSLHAHAAKRIANGEKSRLGSGSGHRKVKAGTRGAQHSPKKINSSKDVPGGSHKSSALPTTGSPKTTFATNRDRQAKKPASNSLLERRKSGHAAVAKPTGSHKSSALPTSSRPHAPLGNGRQGGIGGGKSGSSHSKLSDAQKAAKSERARKRRAAKKK